jgi:hypothetical protein
MGKQTRALLFAEIFGNFTEKTAIVFLYLIYPSTIWN